MTGASADVVDRRMMVPPGVAPVPHDVVLRFVTTERPVPGVERVVLRSVGPPAAPRLPKRLEVASGSRR